MESDTFFLDMYITNTLEKVSLLVTRHEKQQQQQNTHL